MKKRLDVLLVEKGFFESREKAKAVIMSGCVYVNNQKADKAGSSYDENAAVEVRDNRMRYVSRGGYKLEKAMEVFPISLDGKVTMDIGASTGGFTDCMLQNGAKKVYAVDVGYGQLAWKLRNDERVVNLERTNMRYVTTEQVPETVDFFSVDVAFISLKLILPAARGVCADDAQAVCLIKPQFEAGRENVGKNGVVRDRKVHQSVIKECTKASCRGSSTSACKTVFPSADWIIHLSRGRRGISSTCCISSAAIRPRIFSQRPPPR